MVEFLEAERPVIGVTMGDSAGIGPEVIAKALSMRELYEVCRPIVIGDADVMGEATKIAGVRLRVNRIGQPDEGAFEHGTIDIIDLGNIDMDRLRHGEISEMAGRAAVEYVERAVELALKGRVQAIATAPLNKEAMNRAGFNYPGHTEILAQLTQAREYAMMLVAGALRVVHVSTHVPLREACDLITKDSVLKTIILTHRALRELGFGRPRIAVAGLNPHAGEGGLFGGEEADEIAPAIAMARGMGIDALGPIPPDTVFYRANRGEYDGVVAMYHDQGHIPVKLLGFEEGVNITIGLPIIRTSVDHGTAFDIAGRGIASPKSLVMAIETAAKMAKAKSSPYRQAAVREGED